MTTSKPLSTTTLRKKITKQLCAYLQEAGFDTIKGTTAWRHLPNRIELVHFWFTSPSDSRSISCTPASFNLQQGIFFKTVPSGHVMKFEHWLPEAYDSNMLISHRRTLSQPYLKRRDIWLVELDGSNLGECIADAIAVLRSKGESWFIRNRDDSEAIRALLWDEDEGDELGIPKIHYGQLGCPGRNHLIAYIAMGAGKLEIARDAFDRLLNQKVPFLMAGYPDRDYRKVLELLEQQQVQEAGQANNRPGE